jgi:GNAT superfamily N-acetyltransferase
MHTLSVHEARLIAWQTMIDGVAAPAWARRYGSRLSRDGLVGLRMTVAEAIDPQYGDAPHDDYFAAGLLAQSILIALARSRPQATSFLTVLDEGNRMDPLFAAGWRRIAGEALMLATPQLSDAAAADSAIVQLTADADVDHWNAADPEPLAWLRRENLADVQQRHYLLLVDGRPASRVRSTQIDDRAYLTRLFTDPALRSRGFATRLLRRVLHDDARNGVRFSALSADLPAVPLYQRLGWQEVGRTQVFSWQG